GRRSRGRGPRQAQALGRGDPSRSASRGFRGFRSRRREAGARRDLHRGGRRRPVARIMFRAEREGDAIARIHFADHAGEHALEAKAFVDASGDCDFAFFAGASTRYGNDGALNLGTLGTRFGGISPAADISAETVTRAIGQAKARGVGPISKDKSVIARLPISGDLVAYLASEDYDPRDVHSITHAEMAGRLQAWTY